MRRLFVRIAPMTLAPLGQSGDVSGLGEPIEMDRDSGARVYVLGGDERPADNIYGEQPYGDATGRHVAVPLPSRPGGINILDLVDGSDHEILSGKPPFPAFRGWGEWLSYAHPYLTVGNRWLGFGARRNGHPQAHGAKLNDGWLDSL